MGRTYKIDQQTVVPNISVAIRKYHFYTLWKHASHSSEFFDFVNKCRAYIGEEPYTWPKFNEGWSYRTVLHENYMVARDEVYNLIFGWW